MTEVRITPYQPEMAASVMALMGNQSRKSHIWHWQFHDNPYALNFDPVVACLDGEVVGFNGVMPVRLSVNGQECEALWSCDFYVDSRMRGQGVGRLIKDALHERSDRIMALGVSEKAAAVLAHIGWKEVPCMHIMHRIYRVGSWRDLILHGFQWINRLKGGPGPARGRVVRLETLPETGVLETLCQAMAGTSAVVQVIRSPAYLNWKYAQHPLARYQSYLYEAPDGQPGGLLIVREKPEALIVVDYSGRHDASIKAALLEAVTRRGRLNRQHIVLATSDAQFVSVARGMGFYRGRYASRFFVYQKGESPAALADATWFLMAGDSDGELLAAARDALNEEDSVHG